MAHPFPAICLHRCNGQDFHSSPPEHEGQVSFSLIHTNSALLLHRAGWWYETDAESGQFLQWVCFLPNTIHQPTTTQLGYEEGEGRLFCFANQNFVVLYCLHMYKVIHTCMLLHRAGWWYEIDAESGQFLQWVCFLPNTIQQPTTTQLGYEEGEGTASRAASTAAREGVPLEIRCASSVLSIVGAKRCRC